jgi:hypothetical protein
MARGQIAVKPRNLAAFRHAAAPGGGYALRNGPVVFKDGRNGLLELNR